MFLKFILMTKIALTIGFWTTYTWPNIFGPKPHDFGKHKDHFYNFV